MERPFAIHRRGSKLALRPDLSLLRSSLATISHTMFKQTAFPPCRCFPIAVASTPTPTPTSHPTLSGVPTSHVQLRLQDTVDFSKVGIEVKVNIREAYKDAAKLDHGMSDDEAMRLPTSSSDALAQPHMPLLTPYG